MMRQSFFQESCLYGHKMSKCLNNVLQCMGEVEACVSLIKNNGSLCSKSHRGKKCCP